MNNNITSNWTGSETTESLVRKQVLARWGTEEAERYNPKTNCLTIKQWNIGGFRVKQGETALKSYVVIRQKDKDGQTAKTYLKQINLFYDKQVELA